MTAIDNLTRLKHIRDAIQEIQEFIEGKTQNDLKSNRILALAIVKELEIIGEAANKVSTDCQRRYNDIPWIDMIAMRNQLVHVYHGINFDIVWRTVQDDLDPLLEAIKRVIEELGNG